MDGEQQHVPEQASVPSTPGTEQSVNVWLQTGQFPFPELQVFPTPQPQTLSQSDLQLITHLSSIARSLLLNGTSEMTVWSPMVPQYVSGQRRSPEMLHANLLHFVDILALLPRIPLSACVLGIFS